MMSLARPIRRNQTKKKKDPQITQISADLDSRCRCCRMQLSPLCLICVNLRITPLRGLVTEVDTLECARIAEGPQIWIAGADTGWIQLFPFCLICVNLRITPLRGIVREVDTLECSQIAKASPDSNADFTEKTVPSASGDQSQVLCRRQSAKSVDQSTGTRRVACRCFFCRSVDESDSNCRHEADRYL